jgi:hypothetical protein
VDALARKNYMLNNTAQLAQWQADCNVKEACKRFQISIFEPVYLQELAQKFKGIWQVEGCSSCGGWAGSGIA